MWGAFTAWCLAQSPTVTLDNLHSLDLQQFLDSRKGKERGGTLSLRYAWRMLSLVDRVLTHHAVNEGTAKNSAAAELIEGSDELRRANMGTRPSLDYLDGEQGRRLVRYLSEVRPGASDSRQLAGWQELRNLTAVALHLGAGLTPGDVPELLLDAPVIAGGRWKGVPWKLKVPGNGNRPARETPIAPWAGQLLKYWLSVRAQVGLLQSPRPARGGKVEGPFLLPGRSGQQWGKMAHYQAVMAVMVAAGVDDPLSASGGAFRLRHTFAIRQLRRRKSPEDVARWMGIVNLEEMARYQAVIDASEEAV
jgi:integrase